MGLLDRWIKKQNKAQLQRATSPAAPAVAATPPAPAAAPSRRMAKPRSAASYRVVVRPLVTEKAAMLQSKGTYSFIVARSANKTQIKQAIRELYAVEPVAVRVVRTPGKRVRFGRTTGYRSDYKKAFVTLPPGQQITVHEGV